MTHNIKEAIKNRRSYYSLSNASPISDSEIEDIIKFATTHVPSAFNSQSTRIVLLLGKEHDNFWELTKNILKETISSEVYPSTEKKINNSFASGYGTVLFFEDQEVVENLQMAFPTYSENFPKWSMQTSAMHQFTIWTMLEDAGLGASLQHYNPLIDEKVAEIWNIKPTWSLIAQMPFGTPIQQPGEKEFSPLEDRILVFK